MIDLYIILLIVLHLILSVVVYMAYKTRMKMLDKLQELNDRSKKRAILK